MRPIRTTASTSSAFTWKMGIDCRRAICAEKMRRMRLPANRREANQIVGDDVDRPAHGVARQIGIVQCLRHDALPGKCRVPVHQQRQILFFPAFSGAVLLGASAPDGHRIHRLQMAGIRNQMDVNLVPAASRRTRRWRPCDTSRRRRPARCAGPHLQSAAKTSSSGPLRHLHNHCQPPAMAHPHHQLHRSALRRQLPESRPPAESARSRLRAKTVWCPDNAAATPAQSMSARINCSSTLC